MPLASLLSLITERAAAPIGDRDPVLAEIRNAADGSAELLGEAAGVYRATMSNPAAAPKCLSARRALWLCVDAGADLDVARATTPAAAAHLATTCHQAAA
ncbi:hypothetical protein BGP79_15645 [Tersicoccus sp. Bi-70]|nr:hypothetical protein BGP79_15645 [Tersicoccus sp. Bi-70]